MGVAENVQHIVQTEPWRNGQGRPKTSIDSIWAKDTLTLCGADADSIEWEASGSWWWCRKCGHCSNAHRIEHYTVESSERYYDLSLDQFMTRRETQELGEDVAVNQSLHIMGVALRVAASHRPEEFAGLVDKILELAAP